MELLGGLHNCIIDGQIIDKNSNARNCFNVNCWGVDFNSAIDDASKLRSSTGIALDYLSPIGPLSFSISEAITKADSDKTETIRIDIGTTF